MWLLMGWYNYTEIDNIESSPRALAHIAMHCQPSLIGAGTLGDPVWVTGTLGDPVWVIVNVKWMVERDGWI